MRKEEEELLLLMFMNELLDADAFAIAESIAIAESTVRR